jgi:hypothetical protein
MHLPDKRKVTVINPVQPLWINSQLSRGVHRPHYATTWPRIGDLILAAETPHPGISHTPYYHRHFKLYMRVNPNPTTTSNMNLKTWTEPNRVPEGEERHWPISASDPRPAPEPTKRRRLRTHGMDEAGGIRLPAGAAAEEEAPSPPTSAPSPGAVLIAASGGGSGRAGGERVTRSGLGIGSCSRLPSAVSLRMGARGARSLWSLGNNCYFNRIVDGLHWNGEYVGILTKPNNKADKIVNGSEPRQWADGDECLDKKIFCMIEQRNCIEKITKTHLYIMEFLYIHL